MFRIGCIAHFNRTILELKQQGLERLVCVAGDFNRTILELKRGVAAGLLPRRHKTLIAPFWN